MRKQKKAIIVLTLVLAMAMSILTGCGKVTEEDAKAYVQATLDASYKAQFDDYMDITKSEKEEVQRLYDDNIEKIMSSSGISQLGFSGGLEDQYRELFKTMLSKAKYSVGEAAETDSGFEVTVKVEPYAFMDGVEEALTTAVQEELFKDMENIPTEDEMNQMVFEKMHELLEECVENPKYEEAKEIKVNVNVDDKVYRIEEKDLMEIDNNLFVY